MLMSLDRPLSAWRVLHVHGQTNLYDQGLNRYHPSWPWVGPPWKGMGGSHVPPPPLCQGCNTLAL